MYMNYYGSIPKVENESLVSHTHNLLCRRKEKET